MTIREAATDDVESIQRVAEASWNTDYPDILSRESLDEGVHEWYSAEQIRDSLDWTRALLLVAEHDDEVVGFSHAVWDIEEETGDVLRVYVHPDHRGEGIGRQLFEAVRDELADHGVDELRAMVLEQNDLGNTFYSEFGFEWESTEEVTVGGEVVEENTYVLDLSSA